MNPIYQLRKKLSEAFPNLPMSMDVPKDLQTGRYFLDLPSHGIVIEWIDTRGFGVSLPEDSPLYGEGPQNVFVDIDETFEFILNVLKES